MLDTTRTQTYDCPAADELSSFLDGKLPRLRLDDVSDHVERCDQCAALLSTLPGDGDSLVGELRRPYEPELIAPEEASRASALAGSSRPAKAEEKFRPGTVLGPYELVSLLGEGGMGQVWRARHHLLGRDVALKLILPGRLGDGVSLSRFQREIQLLARLDHPNVVRAEHADVIDGTHVLVMEYVPGVSLSDHVRKHGVLTADKACDVVRQAALGLQCAHDKGLVHRDVKPSNLLLTPDGTVKLLDLGLARAAGAPHGDELTASGQVMGTFDYMAPEQWDDSHAVDGRADVYGLGCTAYFLLTGRPPFAEATQSSRLSKMKAHALMPPPPIKAARPDVPEALADVVARMLAKSPADRIQTPGEVAKLLEAVGRGGGVQLPPMPSPVQVGRDESSHTHVMPRVPKRSALAWLLGALALAFVGCIGVTAVGAFGLLWMIPVRNDVKPGGGGQRLDREAVMKAQEPNPRPQPRLEPKRDALVKSFRVVLGRPGAGERGEMGKVVFDVREKDSAWIDVDLHRPAYCYLIAFNPDGAEQFLAPFDAKGGGEEGKRPDAIEAFRYPPDPEKNFGFTDGPGLQAFVLVVSAEPLPSYKVWKQDKTPLWGKVTRDRAWGMWYFDGAKLGLRQRERLHLVTPRETQVCMAMSALAASPVHGLGGVPWEALRRNCVDTPAERYEELLRFFTKRPDVEVHLWGCAVAPGG